MKLTPDEEAGQSISNAAFGLRLALKRAGMEISCITLKDNQKHRLSGVMRSWLGHEQAHRAGDLTLINGVQFNCEDDLKSTHESY